MCYREWMNMQPQQQTVGNGQADLRDLTLSQLNDYVVALGLPAKRGRQIFARLHRPGVFEFSQLGISKEVTALLASHATMSSLTPAAVERSEDTTEKFAFRLADGAMVESV